MPRRPLPNYVFWNDWHKWQYVVPGSYLTCEIRGLVRVTGMTKGPIPVPCCASGLPVVWGIFADSLRYEPASVVSVAYGVPRQLVSQWQDKLGERAIIPEPLATQLYRPARWRMRRRWFRSPPKPEPKPRQRKPKPRHWDLWSDTDDHVIAIFEPREAAAMLGRTVHAIYKRRSRKTVGKANRDRKARKAVRREDYQ